MPSVEAYRTGVRAVPVLLGAATTVAATAALALWADRAHARASRRRLGDVPRRGGREAVVVLGFGDRGPRAGAVNRFRVRAALRSMDPAARESVLVCSGGPVKSDVPEADLLAAYARDGRGYTGPLVRERESRSTRENVVNVAPLVADADRIVIVSDPIHAEIARGYLHELRPDLARRLAPGAEYRPGEALPMKIVTALVDLRRLRSRRRRRRHVRCRNGDLAARPTDHTAGTR